MKNIIIVLVLFVFVLYFFDFGFLKGEITAYPVVCDNDKYINYRCVEGWVPLNPTTYKPNANKQQVLYWTLDVIETLEDCSVVNRSNWTCEYHDGSAKFGFRNGSFWEVVRDDDYAGEIFTYKYVSKFMYRLEEMKWW